MSNDESNENKKVSFDDLRKKYMADDGSDSPMSHNETISASEVEKFFSSDPPKGILIASTASGDNCDAGYYPPSTKSPPPSSFSSSG